MQILSQDQFLQGGSFSVQPKAGTNPEPEMPTFGGLFGKAKQVGIGAVKGLGDAAMGLAKLDTQIKAAVDPFNTYEDYTKAYDKVLPVNPVNPETETQINETLKSDNNYQKAGKVAEFMAEVFLPVTRLKTAKQFLSKGASVAKTSVDDVTARVSQLSDDAFDGAADLKNRFLDVVADLDDKTKTALERADKDVFERFLKQGEDAMLDDRNRTPLESVGDAVMDGLKYVQEQARQIAQQKQSVLDGVSGDKTLDLRFGSIGQTDNTLVQKLQMNVDSIKGQIQDLAKQVNVSVERIKPMLDMTSDMTERQMTIDLRNLFPDATVANKMNKLLTQYRNVENKLQSQLSKAVNQVQSTTAKLATSDVILPKNTAQRMGSVLSNTTKKIDDVFSKMDLSQADNALVTRFKDEINKLGNNPTLGKVDALIDKLQDDLYKTSRSNVIEVTDRITGPMRQIVGELNTKLKDATKGTNYAELNDQYARMAELMNELNARLGKEGASAGAFVKRLFSPSDARTKELFEQLQGITGQDYFRDARIAKFVMDVLGDKRAGSILNQIPESASGAVGRMFDYAKSKLADPIDAARRFIDNKGPSSSASQAKTAQQTASELQSETTRLLQQSEALLTESSRQNTISKLRQQSGSGGFANFFGTRQDGFKKQQVAGIDKLIKRWQQEATKQGASKSEIAAANKNVNLLTKQKAKLLGL